MKSQSIGRADELESDAVEVVSRSFHRNRLRPRAKHVVVNVAMGALRKSSDMRARTTLAILGLGGTTTRVDAQNAAAPAFNRAVSLAASTTQGADWVADEELRRRVRAALHVDPYFYDEHVTVSIENGGVVLRGFVFSDWDLRDALRIARKAAGGRPVIDYLSIKEGGRR